MRTGDIMMTEKKITKTTYRKFGEKSEKNHKKFKKGNGKRQD